MTIFVGGNHEASNLLKDLYYGGWVAENIYYLGASGVINVCKGDECLRVGGISGIDKPEYYLKGYGERYPYVNDSEGLRSIFHFRQFDVQKLKLFSKPVDIFVSHDWPTIATTSPKKDKIKELTRTKPHFKENISKGKFGSHNLSDVMAVL